MPSQVEDVLPAFLAECRPRTDLQFPALDLLISAGEERPLFVSVREDCVRSTILSPTMTVMVKMQ